ncbi:Phenylalanine--tRNA ligase alpha subunit [Brevibacterium iodinum]|nr:Phenylalanine--tRNA ligase alpha subunit [Brevibacterium iodinum]
MRRLSTSSSRRRSTTPATKPAGARQRAIGSLDKADKAAAGKIVGKSRGAVKQAHDARLAELEAERDAAVLIEEAIDVTCPRSSPLGARHPLSLIQEQRRLLRRPRLGSGRSPEIESEWLNFDALNFGPDHPARQMQDTFFVDPPEAGSSCAPTPHRAVAFPARTRCPALRRVPRKTFRTMSSTPPTPGLHQIEGIAIDKA